MRTLATFRVIAVIACCGLCGCTQGGKGKQEVSGSVTVDGTPLSTGSISFQPANPSQGTGGGGGIAAGRFHFESAHGLMPGEYLVTISAVRETGKTIHDYQRGPIAEVAPVRFIETLPLSASVSAEGPNEFNFALTVAKP